MNPDDDQEHAALGDAELREQTAGALGLTGSGAPDVSWRSTVRQEFNAVIADLAFVYDTRGNPRVLTRGKPREDR